MTLASLRSHQQLLQFPEQTMLRIEKNIPPCDHGHGTSLWHDLGLGQQVAGVQYVPRDGQNIDRQCHKSVVRLAQGPCCSSSVPGREPSLHSFVVRP